MRLRHWWSLIGLLAIQAAGAQVAGFHWVDFKQEPDVAAHIGKALQGEDYTAIREVGIAGDSALVFTSRRSRGETTPSGDLWTIYQISVQAGHVRRLLSGYQLRIESWLPFLPGSDQEDLIVTWLDCYACEATNLMSVLHYDWGNGWAVRWASKDPKALPGIAFLDMGVGGIYSYENVDQVWAVLVSPEKPASIGTWYRSRDLKTGKVTNYVKRFSVAASGAEDAKELAGSEAALWERTLCDPKTPKVLSGGQNSEACKALMAKRR